MSKKLLYGLIGIIIAVAVVIFCGIGSAVDGKWFKNGNIQTWHNNWWQGETANADDGHVHTYDLTTWVQGEDSHWHKATCGHDLVTDVEGHRYGANGLCTVCGYKRSSITPLTISTDFDGGLALASCMLMSSDYEAYGVSPQAETAYTFTATVVDEKGTSNGISQEVVAVADWENAQSEWAMGKAIEEYIKVDRLEDNTFVVSCLQSFGEPVLLKVQAVDTEVFAVKRFNYVKRVTSIGFDLSNESNFDFAGMPNSYTATVKCGVGSVQGEVSYDNVYVTFVDEFETTLYNSTYYKYFAQQCNSAGVDFDIGLEFSIDYSEATMSGEGSIQISWENIFLTNMDREDFNAVKAVTNNCEYFKYALIDVTNHRSAPIDFECKLGYSYSYNGIEYSSGYTFTAGACISTGGLGTLPAISDVILSGDDTVNF